MGHLHAQHRVVCVARGGDFFLGNTPPRGTILALDKAEGEASYALSGANAIRFNKSPWQYLLSVLMEQYCWVQREGSTNNMDKRRHLLYDCIRKTRDMKQSWDKCTRADNPRTGPCLSLLSTLVDFLEIFRERQDFL